MVQDLYTYKRPLTPIMMLSVSCSYYLVLGPLSLWLAPSMELYPTPRKKKLVHVFPLFFLR
jgi:hypothetical protein